MRTTLNLDDRLVDDVMSITRKKSRSEAIRVALAGYIRMKNKEKLLAMRGKVQIEDHWQELRALECQNDQNAD